MKTIKEFNELPFKRIRYSNLFLKLFDSDQSPVNQMRVYFIFQIYRARFFQ